MPHELLELALLFADAGEDDLERIQLGEALLDIVESDLRRLPLLLEYSGLLLEDLREAGGRYCPQSAGSGRGSCLLPLGYAPQQPNGGGSKAIHARSPI